MSFTDWLLADLRLPAGVHSKAEPVHPWWQVMCLTGVDYFSTLGYQPGIAYLAAGLLSPLATLILVLVTLFAAVPVYSRVAQASPNGQGSIAMLEKLFPRWSGKTFVLILLGFATTDFIITMTLSAADASAHLIQNPFMPPWAKSQMVVTVVLLLILAMIFLQGFKEAIGVAVVLVGVYLAVNAVVTVVAIQEVLAHPEVISHWRHGLSLQFSSPWPMIGLALLLFPKLALGLSGFETGVAVMPLVRGEGLEGRVRNTQRLLLTAAVIMSVFLIATSLVTTLLIEPEKFKDGGEANGRAMAYLAHKFMGAGFGTVYDISTILILAFAGASAMAGLLNLIPRYLPRFGMAPEWAKGARPLVMVFTGIGLLVTFLFHANVDAQGGAYATGVLVLITSGSFAVTIHHWKSGWRLYFLSTALVFTYTTVLNIFERPEGVKIAAVFIGSIILSSLVSRAVRSTELRITAVEFDPLAEELLAEDEDQIIRLVARRPRQNGDAEQELDSAAVYMRHVHNIANDERIIFLELEPGDASEFEHRLPVRGERVGNYALLKGRTPVVANAIAAILIELERRTGHVPHGYFTWSDGSPMGNVFRFLLLGEGDTAPMAHEVLRRAIVDPKRRPVIHVG